MSQEESCTHHATEENEWLEARGVVSAVNGDQLEITLASQGCGRCHEPGGCGGKSLTQMMSSPRVYRLPNTIQAHPGDKVIIQGVSGQIHRAAWQAYVLPWLGCMVGAAIGQGLWGDTAAMAGGGLGLLLAWIVVRTGRAGKITEHPHLKVQFDHS